VASSSDDVEERVSDGRVTLDSSDLELIRDGRDQTVGIRFAAVAIPRQATVLNAYLQFQTDESTSEATALAVWGEDADTAAAFSATPGNVSSRPRTPESVTWSPPAWTSVGAQESGQRTPNLAVIVQRIVDRSGWASGNALALIVTGSGWRVAEAYEGDRAGAPLLHVEYVAGP
jgi:hypothetical protein